MNKMSANSPLPEEAEKLSEVGDNLLLLTDCYKLTHWKQYPPKTTKVYSYFESRGGDYPETVFFGLQYLLKRYLEGKVVTQEKIAEAEEITKLTLGNKNLFNKDGWEYILNQFDGQLPISIKAVPEGTVVPTHNVLITVENTDPNCWWLTNYLETLLVQVWYPITVATQSREIKKVIHDFLDKTGKASLVNFKLHDFGFRGVSSVESAGIGGAAHLVNFQGTDTVAAVSLLRKYYHHNTPGFSIPAAEHSTITSWGKENEVKAYENMLDQFTGARAVVSDSFDIFNACEKLWGEQLKDKILNLEGSLVIRPDSGDPAEVVLKVIEILGRKFGYQTNSKGFKVLNDKIRVIQGDGVNYLSIKEILQTLFDNNWSIDNISFGMGGALLQKLNRDTQKFAFKCSYVEVNGEGRDVFKDPITDKGKISKKGRLQLIKLQNGCYETVPEHINVNESPNELVEVFCNGKLLKDHTLDEVRARAKV
jgi:nicotinamide phosphoribosyltransferase